MPEPRVTTELTRHFFRRFFENDVLDSDGEMVTSVVRAVSAVAVPGLMLAFYLQNSYPDRPLWGRVEDQYFFVLYSFVSMAGVALFEWETLFPERLDFLILAPLPLRPRQLLMAKAGALGGFLGMFLIAANLFGALVLPAVSKGVFWRMFWAQSIAAGLAGVFAAASVTAVGAVLLCVLPATLFRKALWSLQMLGTAALVLLLIGYARFADRMQEVLQYPDIVARYVPTIWFLGVYQRLLHGEAAQSFAQPAAQRAWLAVGVAVGGAAVTYPFAWIRMQRLALEGEAIRAKAPARLKAMARSLLIRNPTERAIFSFIGKTLRRNSRYGVYLAIYCGVGLALALSCSVGLSTAVSPANKEPLVLSSFGLHAVLPLLLFWTVAGLHSAFAVPQNLPARWLFRIAGVDPQACVGATRHWVTGPALILVAAASAVCAGLGWTARPLLVQAVCGLCWTMILVESFFVTQQGAPFTRPRSPGKTNVPAVLTLFIGVLPPLLFGFVWMEQRLERRPAELLLPAGFALLVRAALRWIRSRLIWTGEEPETADGDFQLLGLTGPSRA